jgi:hypothetical protein
LTGVNLVHVAAFDGMAVHPDGSGKNARGIGEASGAVPWRNDGEAALAAIPAGRPIAVAPLLFRKIAVADVPHP